MIREATRLQQEGVAFAGVVYAHQLRVPIGACIRDLELIANAGELEGIDNKILYLLL